MEYYVLWPFLISCFFFLHQTFIHFLLETLCALVALVYTFFEIMFQQQNSQKKKKNVEKIPSFILFCMHYHASGRFCFCFKIILMSSRFRFKFIVNDSDEIDLYIYYDLNVEFFDLNQRNIRENAFYVFLT